MASEPLEEASVNLLPFLYRWHGNCSHLKRRTVDRFPELDAAQPVQGLLVGVGGLARRSDGHLSRPGGLSFAHRGEAALAACLNTSMTRSLPRTSVTVKPIYDAGYAGLLEYIYDVSVGVTQEQDHTGAFFAFFSCSLTSVKSINMCTPFRSCRTWTGLVER